MEPREERGLDQSEEIAQEILDERVPSLSVNTEGVYQSLREKNLKLREEAKRANEKYSGLKGKLEMMETAYSKL